MKKLQGLTLSLLTLVFLSTSFAAGDDKLNSSLRFLRSLRERPVDTSKFRRETRATVEAEKATVTVKFDHVLSGGEIADLERKGLSFYYIGGQVARTGAIYPVNVPWTSIDELSGEAKVVRVESAWRPAMYPTLDVSAHEVQADSAWKSTDPLGYPVTGKGTRIADFDTGIDVYHPSFFYADGDTFDWLDLDQNSVYTNGNDAVDLDGDGVFDPGETLRLREGWIYDPARVWGPAERNNADNVYQTYWDWVYADLNNNQYRDFGPGAGYTESDPGYGEPMFVTLDENENGLLDVGEKLVALGTSKIYATMNGGSVERTRGVDLMQSEPDDYGHGTPVAGILAGGIAGRHRFAGIAPDAEILAGYVFSGVPVSYLVPWARSRGADAMLYEFGSFIYEFLDGSSLDEEIISTEHASTLQITPSGNLGRGAKHAVATVAAHDSITLDITVPYYNGVIQYLYITTLWRTYMIDLVFRIKSPKGTEVTLDHTDVYVDNYYVWSDFDTSVRGTHKLDLYVDRNLNPQVLGTWRLKIVNVSYLDAEIICNVADDNSSWAGGSEFLNYVSDQKNVTLPATSDHAFVNGSYSTRGFEGYEGVGGGSISVGEISKFSGRGKRVDGLSLVDICTPGNYDVYTARSHQDYGAYPLGSYRQFSGTSAAGPHLAGAAALVQQALPGITAGQVEFLLTSNAATDAFTGAVYNDTWGYGKLRVLAAIGAAIGVQEIVDGRRAPELLLDQNYPNPFNPTTWIPFYLPKDGNASVKIYNVRGELVKIVRDTWYEKGAHSVRWNGTDQNGRAVASGVYFCALEQGENKQTRKMILVR